VQQHPQRRRGALRVNLPAGPSRRLRCLGTCCVSPLSAFSPPEISKAVSEGHPKGHRGLVTGVRSVCEQAENQGRSAKCADYRAEPPDGGRRAELSTAAECSRLPKEWLPIGHRFRTLSLSGCENQGLARVVRDAEPDPTRKCEHFLQIENTAENDGARNAVQGRIQQRTSGVAAASRCYGRGNSRHTCQNERARILPVKSNEGPNLVCCVESSSSFGRAPASRV
jgi:hypothetical protein